MPVNPHNDLMKSVLFVPILQMAKLRHISLTSRESDAMEHQITSAMANWPTVGTFKIQDHSFMKEKIEYSG